MIKIFLVSFISIFFLFQSNVYGNLELESARVLVQEKKINEVENEEDFRLSDGLTRREMMKLSLPNWYIGEPICEEKFDDVLSGDWGCKYIEFALDKGFITANENFNPDSNVSQIEALKIIINGFGVSVTSDTEDWRQSYVDRAILSGLIAQGGFEYDKIATRGWIFTIIARKPMIKGLDEDTYILYEDIYYMGINKSISISKNMKLTYSFYDQSIDFLLSDVDILQIEELLGRISKSPKFVSDFLIDLSHGKHVLNIRYGNELLRHEYAGPKDEESQNLIDILKNLVNKYGEDSGIEYGKPISDDFEY